MGSETDSECKGLRAWIAQRMIPASGAGQEALMDDVEAVE